MTHKTVFNRRSVLTAGAATLLATPFIRPSSAAAPDKVTLGTMRLVSSAPFFLGQSLGIFAEHGIETEMQYFDAAQPVAVAAAAGSIDFGCAAFSIGLFNTAANGSVGAIAGASRDMAGFPLVGYLATKAAYDAGLKTPKDLLGKRIGITQLGASYHYIMAMLEEKYGKPETPTQLVQLNSMSNIAAGLEAAQVDGALLPLTFTRPLVNGGKVVQLGWVGDETPWQLGAIFGSSKVLESEDLTRRFLTAYQKACDVYFTELLEARVDGAAPVNDKTRPYLEPLAAVTNLKPEDIARELPYIDRLGRMDLADVRKQIAWGQQNGFIDGSVKAEDVVREKYALVDA